MTQLRRGLMVLLGLFTVAAWLSSPEARGLAAHAQQRATSDKVRSARARVPALPRLAAQHDHSGAEPGALAAALPTSSTPALARQRGAVDALAAGDFVAAQRIYAELAGTVAGPSVYAEAARILSARLRAQSP